jgi:hypothetical protein
MTTRWQDLVTLDESFSVLDGRKKQFTIDEILDDVVI